MKLLFVTLALTISLSAFATCMSTCRDTDAGNDPEYAGVGIQVTQCAAPGGPVHRTETFHFDNCSEGVHSEIVCDGMVGIEGVKEIRYECRKCSDVREGVCLEVGSIIQ